MVLRELAQKDANKSYFKKIVGRSLNNGRLFCYICNVNRLHESVIQRTLALLAEEAKYSYICSVNLAKKFIC